MSTVVFIDSQDDTYQDFKVTRRYTFKGAELNEARRLEVETTLKRELSSMPEVEVTVHLRGLQSLSHG